MRILHLSDLHFGYEDGAAIAAVHTFAMDMAPDLIIASGDLSAAGLQTELDACAAWLTSLGPPVVATPGNHDAPYFAVLPRFYRPFRRFRAAARGRMMTEWRSDALTVVTINTARGWQMRFNWALGAVNPAQTWRVARTLAQAPPDALKIVVTHHPLVFPPHAALTGKTHGGAGALQQLIEAGAHLFLAGHLHVLRATRHEAGGRHALAVTAGTLSSRLRGDPQGFNLIETAPGGVRIARYAIAEGVVTRIGETAARLEAGRLLMPIEELASPG